MDQASVAASVGAYPTSRTWEGAARLLAAIEASDMDEKRAQEVRVAAVQYLVGPTAAKAFFTFLAYPDMIQPAKALEKTSLVLKKKELFEPTKPDRAFIFLAALTKYVIAENKVETWKKGWEILGLFAEKDCVPIASAFALILNRRRPEGVDQDPHAMKSYSDVLERF